MKNDGPSLGGGCAARPAGRTGAVLLACAASAFLLPSTTPAGLMFLGDFEQEGIVSLRKGDPNASKLWYHSGNPPTVVKATSGVRPRAGTYMMKSFLNRLESPVSYRTEVVRYGPRNIYIGREYWYGFSIYLPADYAPDNIWEIVAQWHGCPDFEIGEDWRNPVMALDTRRGIWSIVNRWDAKRNTFESGARVYDGSVDWDLGRYQREKWTDWVFHVKWSYQADGLLEVWQDGIRVIRREGPNCYNDAEGPYFKTGLYKGWHDRYEPKGSVGVRTLYHDEFRIGDVSASYAQVAPPGPIQLPDWPLPPNDVQLVVLSQSKIQVVWRDNSSNEDSFKIDRRQSGATTWVRIAAPGRNATTYTDSGLSADTRYYYMIKASSSSAGDSPYSAAVATTTGPLTAQPPAAPAGLAATAVSPNRVELQWTDRSGNETSFKIDRRQSGTEAWVRIAVPASDTTTYTDTGLPADTKFYYMVKAWNAAGNSDYSNVADARTFPPPPAPPAELAARAAGSTAIALSWRDRSANETGFKIDRRQSGTTPWVRLATTAANVSAWSDTGLPPDTRFYYLVKAYNAGGDSSCANKADATTLDGIDAGTAWKYRKGTAEASDPAGAWRRVDFDDAAWAEGAGPIGYSDYAVPFGTELTDMRGNYTCVFLRRSFAVAEPAAVSKLRIDAAYDDGFILWVNGAEVARVNVDGVPGSTVPCDAVAADNQNSAWAATLTGATMPALRRGENVIAVQVFNRSLDTSGDCLFDLELALVCSPLSVAADADADSLPDAWEAALLSGLSDPSDQSNSADPDRDGLSNLEEYVAGTDPTAGGSCFAVDARLVGGQVRLSFPTIAAAGPGYDGCTRHYALESAAVGQGPWRPVPGCADIIGAGQLVRYTTTESQPRLYRARVWLDTP
ncbi:MAG: heparin lyase I family protein [Kiritimatiellae bacterium]|nr:heparin lyase I family protein [Kiritimatiellia bacterium]